MSACIAQRLSTVSSRVSPLVEDDTVIFRLMTSADRRFAAISKVVRVRVEGSKNRLNTDLPRRSGTFFTSRSVTPMKDAAVSRMCTRISRGSPSIVSRCWSLPSPLSCGFRIGQSQEKFAALVARQAQTLGEPGAARAYADEPGGFGDAGAELPRELFAQRFSVGQVHPDNSAG